MYFKPKIFISSVMKGNLELRKKISDILESDGAEVLLYEKNLTPSVDPNTYKSSIHDADLVIFIIDQYGTPTPDGLTGTEEEYKEAELCGIKSYVFISKGIQETPKDFASFIENIKKKGVSYYEYKDNDDLLKQITNCLFNMARDCFLNRKYLSRLPSETLVSPSFNADYVKGMNYLAQYKKMVELTEQKRLETSFDPLYSNIILALTDIPSGYIQDYEKNKFMDQKLFDLLNAVATNCLLFEDRHSHYFTTDYSGNGFEIHAPLYGQEKVYRCYPADPSRTDEYRRELLPMFNHIKDSINDLENYLKDRKNDIDLTYNISTES